MMNTGSASILAGLAHGFDRGVSNYINVKRLKNEEDIRRGQLQGMAEYTAPRQNVMTGADTINLPSGATGPPPASVMSPSSVMSQPDYSGKDIGELSRLATQGQLRRSDPAMAAERQYHVSTSLLDMIRRKMIEVAAQRKAAPSPALDEYFKALNKQYDQLDMETEQAHQQMMMGGRDPLLGIPRQNYGVGPMAGASGLPEEYVPASGLSFNPDRP